MLYKIIDIIYKIFRCKKIKTLSSSESLESDYNYLLFFIDDKTKEASIKTNIVDLSDDACYKYALMLFNINEGFYKQSTFDLLSSVGKQSLDIEAFMQNVIINWMYLIKDKNLAIDNKEWANNKPIIPPTQFSKYAK
jgi:hypothetical protein